MPEPIIVMGDRLYLRTLAESDLGERYLSWINNPDTNLHLEVQHSALTLESLREYLRGFDNEHTNFAFAVMLKGAAGAGDSHIGNITIRVNGINQYGTIGTLISQELQGKGFGTEARSLICQFGFDQLGLAKIVSGTTINNIASIKSNQRLGFVQEGHFPEHLVVRDKRVDAVQLGLLKRNFRPFTPRQ